MSQQLLVAGRYRLLNLVGAGGMGRVWLGRDEMLHRDVAVKEVVPPSWLEEADRGELRLRTLREARAAARLNHPNVVQIYDVVHDRSSPWIVMEYVSSRTLQEIINDEGPLSPVRAAWVGLPIVAALRAAHAAGVLHRDVKPHNVLIADDGRVLLTDFGLATFVSGEGAVTGPGTVVGSPQFIAPERAREGISDPRADLWSLGATLYAAVEGRSPYARSSAMETLTALAVEPPDPATRAGPLLPVLTGLLQRQPSKRLTAAETENLLRIVAAGEVAEEPALHQISRAKHRRSEGLDSAPFGPTTYDRPGVSTRGFTDSPAEQDLLGRGPIVDVLAELFHPDTPVPDADLADGPQVVTVDGPWGSGKTTVMHLVKRRLDQRAAEWEYLRKSRRSLRERLGDLRRSVRFTPAGAHRLLGVWKRPSTVPWSSELHSQNLAESTVAPPVTALFEPWAHQTSEQVWAGLAKSITQSVVPAILPNQNAQRRFWFARNAERLDATRLRRALWQGVASPLLRISLFALIAPVIVQFSRPESSWKFLEVEAGRWAWICPLVLLLLALMHTVSRYFLGRAGAFLPEEIFTGPVLSSGLTDKGSGHVLSDPLHRAQSGSLYLVQHDVSVVLELLKAAKRELVLFVDDLDRCGPEGSVEVLQAINLFISGSIGGCRLVIGLDQAIVAGQLDEFYIRRGDSVTRYGDDPSAGWSFLRKLTHLPVVLPRVKDSLLDIYLNDLLGPIQITSGSLDRSGVLKDGNLSTMLGLDRKKESHPSVSTAVSMISDVNVLALERHSEVRSYIRQRLGRYDDTSGRETKRLLTVWQFYLRLWLRTEGNASLSRSVEVAKYLVTFAEVITRWPAMVRQLSRVRRGKPGLVALAQAANDQLQWDRAVSEFGLGADEHRKAVRGLRELLSGEDGAQVGKLAESLL